METLKYIDAIYNKKQIHLEKSIFNSKVIIIESNY